MLNTIFPAEWIGDLEYVVGPISVIAEHGIETLWGLYIDAMLKDPVSQLPLPDLHVIVGSLKNGAR